MPKPKVLFVATVSGHINAFHLPYLQWFQSQGYETHVATGDAMGLPYVDVHHVLPMARTPFSLGNVRAISMMKRIMDTHQYQLVHAHTPMGGVVARVAGVWSSTHSKMLYTAHGFHFYNGAPLVNWLVYYPIEYALAGLTDVLLTINQEDYLLAKHHHFPARHRIYVPGVGIDLQKYTVASAERKQSLRRAYGFAEDGTIYISVAELNENKNQKLVLQAFARLRKHRRIVPNAVLLCVGAGRLLDEYQAMANELGIADDVHFLGHRDDVAQLLQLSDVFVTASLREGLPVSVMEALATGLPVVASSIRGQVDLIQNGVNGLLVPFGKGEVKRFAHAMQTVALWPQECPQLAETCRDSLKPFSLRVVAKRMHEIYVRSLDDNC